MPVGVAMVASDGAAGATATEAGVAMAVGIAGTTATTMAIMMVIMATVMATEIIGIILTTGIR